MKNATCMPLFFLGRLFSEKRYDFSQKGEIKRLFDSFEYVDELNIEESEFNFFGAEGTSELEGPLFHVRDHTEASAKVMAFLTLKGIQVVPLGYKIYKNSTAIVVCVRIRDPRHNPVFVFQNKE